MFDDISGRRVGAEQAEYQRLYIVTSPESVVEASRILSARGIPHSVEGQIPNASGLSRWPMPLPRNLGAYHRPVRSFRSGE